MSEAIGAGRGAGTRRVVVAVDSFKGSIGAAAAARAVAEGIASTAPRAEVELRPMADGGEGTLEAFSAAPGARRMPVDVRGPDGATVAAQWLLLERADGATGVVELASTSGLELLGERRLPWSADTYGFGQAIAAALAHGVDRLVLGIGSSASTDGGAGMLAALGARLRDEHGAPFLPGAAGLESIVSVDLSTCAPPPTGGAIVLTDVTNPLLGERGAAAVFGPQKGLDGAGIARADRALARFAPLLDADPELPGSGAAGGTGFALRAWGAALVPGAAAVAELIGLDSAIRSADLVVTGEGSYDRQSLDGKVPGFVLAVARDAGVPIALVAGRIDPAADRAPFSSAIALTELAGGGAAAMAAPARWLRQAGEALGSRL
ncbi:glycerate kinase [Agrococcus sp. DT81.2]|uniref:glycerate kinase n=1 Tax=Agrococcus sp. DT81.2 TaxID=3393414 RepID=UPI003CE5C912